MSRFQSVCDHTEEIRRLARGHWDTILGRLVPEIGLAMEKPGRHVKCPFHGGKDDFRVEKFYAEDGRCHCTCGHWDGFAMIIHARNWTFREAVAEVEAVLGGVAKAIYSSAPAPSKSHQKPEDAAAIQAKLQKYWSEAIALDDPEASYARRYLAARGLGEIDDVNDWRFHPRLPFHDAETSKFAAHPAMIGVLRMPDGRVATLHRTWLHDVNGAIKVLERKLYTSIESNPVTGGAIRLCETNSPVLSIGEGIETTLSARLIAPEYPVWSCVNKELMKSVRLPEHVRVVTIFADRDRSYGGQEAAVDLVDRLRSEGRRAMAFLPPEAIAADAKGVDWNDFLQSHGVVAARNHFAVQRWKRQVVDVLEQVARNTR